MDDGVDFKKTSLQEDIKFTITPDDADLNKTQAKMHPSHSNSMN